ncbi:hypothetical protein ONZ45_g6740 [Pleurotus djamor]|nr:hypothetical protein ONZ45_g6740 [Pleurotus djamor]
MDTPLVGFDFQKVHSDTSSALVHLPGELAASLLFRVDASKPECAGETYHDDTLLDFGADVEYQDDEPSFLDVTNDFHRRYYYRDMKATTIHGLPTFEAYDDVMADDSLSSSSGRSTPDSSFPGTPEMIHPGLPMDDRKSWNDGSFAERFHHVSYLPANFDLPNMIGVI